VKQSLLIIAAAVFIVIGMHNASAGARDFPEKGWHTGSYVLAHGGMMQATDDKNFATNLKFDGTFIPAIGFTFGYDVLDFFGIMFQATYGGFTSGNVGDGSAGYPSETGKQHVVNLSAAGRFVFLTHWTGQPGAVKILPYIKAGAVGRIMYLKAQSNANRMLNYGIGPLVGAGIEFLVRNGFYFGFDATEHFMFMQNIYKTVNSTRTKTFDGGFLPSFQLLGTVGYHF